VGVGKTLQAVPTVFLLALLHRPNLHPYDHYNWLKVVDGMTPPRYDSGQGTGPVGRLDSD